MVSELRIAVQKNGRLTDSSMRLLKECGLSIENGTSGLKARAANFPLEVIFLRDDDIPQYVTHRLIDAGIVGRNVVLEKGAEVALTQELGFGRCRLSLAIRREEEYTGPEYFEGRAIATSFPRILTEFLHTQGVKARIEEIRGSVEISPGIGLADAICDIVSTGSTLLANGLREVATVLHSEALLIAAAGLAPEKHSLLEQLQFRIRAVLNARRNKYILLNAPDAALGRICAILPGMRSPTVLPLAESGWSSVHSVVNEDTFWEVIDRLRAAGAEGILVVPIEKMLL